MAVGLLALGGGGWLLWYLLVLRPAAKQLTPWGPEWLARMVSGWLYKFGSWYLNFSHNGEEALKWGIWKDDKQHLWVWHPHGAFTVAALYFVAHWHASNYPGGTRGKRFCAVAPLLLKIPFLAEFLLLCHSRSVDSKTFNALLANGGTVAIQPGGLPEQVATDQNAECLFFPTRLGFIRSAIRYGTPLIPIYAFGENQLYATATWTRR
ncbi:unnamed protein product, partial [Polarella glacialis]